MQGTLKQHIQHYREQNDLESRLAFDNAPKGAGSKQRQKKPRRGQNNVEQQPILAEVDPNAVIDPDLDVNFRRLKSHRGLVNEYCATVERVKAKHPLPPPKGELLPYVDFTGACYWTGYGFRLCP